MAEKMTAMAAGAPAVAAARKPLLFQYRWVFATLLVATGLLIWRLHANWNPSSPEDMLAEAYSQRRTLELRFGKARHAPIQEGRGGAKSSLDRPQPLINAEAIIFRGLKSHPDDPAWLQAKGRADLLAWNYDSAIRSFKQALDAASNSPELETDLASAFFERAEATGQYFDFGAALELLGKALDAQPDNAVALFNRAIIAERMRLYEQSTQDWEHYLRVDPDGEWAAEARQHLESIQKKKSVR
jgi:tetratricopeptide (TPR) repeat protein